MSEWHKAIVHFHQIESADDPESLVLGAPATATSLVEFESFRARELRV